MAERCMQGTIHDVRGRSKALQQHQHIFVNAEPAKQRFMLAHNWLGQCSRRGGFAEDWRNSLHVKETIHNVMQWHNMWVPQVPICMQADGTRNEVQ